MGDSVERLLKTEFRDRCYLGQLLVRRTDSGNFVICHRDDETAKEVEHFDKPESALEIARFDDAGNYRPLKTAPNLRHRWRLTLGGSDELRRALDYFYPGRLALFVTWKDDLLIVTPLRATLNRQTGMYRVAAEISDRQIDHVVGNFCRSNGGCLRTILWKRDASGATPSSKLPPEKFDPASDQLGGLRSATAVTTIPLLCQEACNLLVNECRKTVKMEGVAPSAPE